MKTGLTIFAACILIATVSGLVDPDPPADDADDATTTTTQETTTVVHGNWGDWGAYSSCSANCGTGTQYRSRSCNNPAPSGGDDCIGDSTESTSCSADSECCAPQVFDVALLIDVTFSSTQHTRIETFFKDVVSIFEIAPSQTRISVATVGSTTSLGCSFTEYTTESEITSYIDGISREYYSTANSKDAFDFVRGTMLTTENGARDDVSDVLIMLISDVNTDDVDVSAQKLKDNGVTLMIIEEEPSWSATSKLQSLADLYSEFSYIYSYTLGTVKTNIETGFPCNYFCGTSFFALDSPSTLSTGNDPSVGYLYLMTDSPYKATCCGATSAWEFYAVNHGTVEMMVFRQTGENTYYLVGYSTIIVPAEYVNTSVSFPLTATERIAMVSGDIIGWYTSGANIIGHADCDTVSRADCPQTNKKMSMPGATFTVGQSIDFSSAETFANKGYSIKVATTNNSELALTAIQNETEIEENTPIGYKVLYFRVSDPDLNDNTTWELSGQSSLFAMSDLANDQVQLLLQTKLPDGAESYVITVKGIDSCQHTASATVTVSTYNAPPIINNLPSIYSISETTKSAIHLYTINVTDATNDPICCTMPYSLPVSNNFEFRTVGGVYSLWTVEEPAFAYNDNNAYRIFVCCQDNLGSTTLYLMLQILENKIEIPYVPPSWLYRALIISMIPIAFMTMLACATLIVTMFFLGDTQQVEEDETNLSELTETTSNAPENDAISPSLTENSTGIETVEETIQFKNLYNDEIVNIPIWRGKWKHAVNKVGAQNAWHAGMSENKRTIDFADDPYLEPRTKGDAFGVELKLFHYGGRPIQNVSEEEKAASIFQKKNTMKEKWLETIEKAKKKNIVRKKSATNKVSDEMTNANKVEEINEQLPTEKGSLERTVVSPEYTDIDTNDNNKEEVTNESSNNQGDEVNSVGSVETDDVISVSTENNSPEEEVDDEELLNIFNEIVEPGTAAAGTHLNK